jgi:hypothetical protein
MAKIPYVCCEKFSSPTFGSHYSSFYLNYMQQLKKITLGFATLCLLSLSGCFNFIEEVTFNKNGSGKYALTIDMSGMKGMMEMLKGMGEAGADSLATTEGELQVEGVEQPTTDVQADAPAEESTDMGGGDESFSQLGEQLSGGIVTALKDVKGITNVVEMSDTVEFKFGYSFDFATIEALNSALRIINKEKYDSRADETFRYKGKSFERLSAGNIGASMKQTLESEGEAGEEGSADMMKSFFADMTYTTIYHFEGRTIKKNSNSIGQVSADGKTLTIELKPFNEDQARQKADVAAKLKLK